MSFGDAPRPAGSADEVEWIGAACGGGEWTVGGLVPNHFESVVRIAAPESDDGDWWALYRDMFVTVSSIGERHPATPERAWFASRAYALERRTADRELAGAEVDK